MNGKDIKEIKRIRDATLNQGFEEVEDAVNYFYFAIENWLRRG